MFFTLQKLLLLIFCACVVLTGALIAKTALVLNGCEGCLTRYLLDAVGMDYGQNWAGASLEQIKSMQAKLTLLQYAVTVWTILYVLYSGYWYAEQFQSPGGGATKFLSLFTKAIIMFGLVFGQMALVIDIATLIDSMG